jgi:hypothetical protein
VGGIIDQLAVYHRTHFIYPVGEQEPAIEYRDFPFGLREILAIHVDGPDHARGLLDAALLLSTIPNGESMGVVAGLAGG